MNMRRGLMFTAAVLLVPLLMASKCGGAVSSPGSTTGVYLGSFPPAVTANGGYWVRTGGQSHGGNWDALWTLAQVTGGAALGAAAGATGARLASALGNPCKDPSTGGDYPDSRKISAWTAYATNDKTRKRAKARRNLWLDCGGLRRGMQGRNSVNTTKQVLDCISAIISNGQYQVQDNEYLWNFRNAWVVVTQKTRRIVTATAGRHGWEECAKWSQ